LLFEVALCCSVAFAGSQFEPAPVKDSDLAASVSDDVFIAQQASGNRYGASLHTQHVSQKLVGKIEMIGM